MEQIKRTNKQRMVYAYLLSGNSPIDLMDVIWNILTKEQRNKLAEEAKQVQKDWGDDEFEFKSIYDQRHDETTAIIWG